MSKIDEVRADMVKAMKAKDKDTKETLSIPDFTGFSGIAEEQII